MTITRVAGQHISGAVSSTSPVSIVLPNNPTAGNLVVIGVSTGSGTNPSLAITVKDANNNSYTATTNSPGSDGTFSTIGIWYLQNAPANASKTVSISWTGGTTAQIDAWMQEYAGAATTGVLEQEQIHPAFDEGGTGSAINLPSFTPTNANDLIFTVSSISQGYSTPGAGYSTVDAIQDVQASSDQIQTTATATGTYANSGQNTLWIGMVAAFIVAPAGGPAVAQTDVAGYVQNEW